ncbi:MAG: hypothetical protein CEN92_79 [Candidatus Berkelbacteria bacterium Licking1014_96]|uniref:Uncharacterized protein n=1 Tax=Candidatus Berkelbacteria bacterium Licking1014_96 TaxID=2017149 RepID=A0A554LH44_9BACT|nr:MAG: hypothetical protein CEN92_79 [Candidatus Berkelbacteria bacterium Licking1014_96]
MAKYFVLVIFILGFLGLGLGFFCGFALFGGTANLIILVLVSSFFLGAKKEGLIITLILAAFYDLYLYSFFGLSIIAVLLIYFLLSFLESKIAQRPGYLLVLASVFLASIVFDLFTKGGLSLKEKLDFLYILAYNILPSALLNLILALPFYLLARKIISLLKLYRLIEPQEKKYESFF